MPSSGRAEGRPTLGGLRRHSLLVEDVEEKVGGVLRVHDREPRDDRFAQLGILLRAAEGDERLRVTVEKETIDDSVADVHVRIALVERLEDRRRALAEDEPEALDRRHAELRVLFAAGELAELVGRAADEHRLDDA